MFKKIAKEVSEKDSKVTIDLLIDQDKHALCMYETTIDAINAKIHEQIKHCAQEGKFDFYWNQYMPTRILDTLLKEGYELSVQENNCLVKINWNIGYEIPFEEYNHNDKESNNEPVNHQE